MKSTKHTILEDFKRNWLFLCILYIGAVPQFINRSLYLWLILLFFFWTKRTLRIDKNSCLILIFSFFYTLSRLLFSPPPFSIVIFYLLYPFIMYECGIYISRRIKNIKSLVLIVFGLILCYASWSIFNNLYDFLETGAIVNPMRTFADDDIDIEHFIPATHHNSMLAMAIGGLGFIFFKTIGAFQHKMKFFIIILSLIALFASIHLLNRSAVVIAAASLLTGYFWSGVTPKKILFTLLYLVIVIVILLIIFKDNIFVQTILDGFSSRELNETGSAETGGDRFGRWLEAPYWILTHPLGSKGLYYKGEVVMAHNTWLDTGIDSGIIAIFIIILMTAKFIKAIFVFVRRKNIPSFIRGYMVLITVSLALQFSVEPILQSFHQLFYVVFFFWSLFIYFPNYHSKREPLFFPYTHQTVQRYN